MIYGFEIDQLPFYKIISECINEYIFYYRFSGKVKPLLSGQMETLK